MADILTLTDARTALRLPTADTSNDADLSATYIPAVTAVVEEIAGPQTSHTGLTWTADGGAPAVLLPSPVTAVTSVVESGTTLGASDYTVDLAGGIVYRGSTQSPILFIYGRQNIVITYNAVVTAAANVKLAARIILVHLWENDNQGDRPAFGSPSDDVITTPAGFAIPRRAYELLQGNLNVPGFA